MNDWPNMQFLKNLLVFAEWQKENLKRGTALIVKNHIRKPIYYNSIKYSNK